jgi:hypothetical protein
MDTEELCEALTGKLIQITTGDYGVVVHPSQFSSISFDDRRFVTYDRVWGCWASNVDDAIDEFESLIVEKTCMRSGDGLLGYWLLTCISRVWVENGWISFNSFKTKIEETHEQDQAVS